MPQNKNYYQILGVDEKATPEEIKKSYYKLALQWHPDKNPDKKEEAEEMFKEISKAYQVLGNLDLRQKYDCNEDVNNFVTQEEIRENLRRQKEIIEELMWEKETEERGDEILEVISEIIDSCDSEMGRRSRVNIEDLDDSYKDWEEKIWAMQKKREINQREFLDWLRDFETQMVNAIKAVRKEKDRVQMEKYKIDFTELKNERIRNEISNSTNKNNVGQVNQADQLILSSQYREVSGEIEEGGAGFLARIFEKICFLSTKPK
jgi:curved DNA-binding protein CbpA